MRAHNKEINVLCIVRRKQHCHLKDRLQFAYALNILTVVYRYNKEHRSVVIAEME